MPYLDEVDVTQINDIRQSLSLRHGEEWCSILWSDIKKEWVRSGSCKRIGFIFEGGANMRRTNIGIEVKFE